MLAIVETTRTTLWQQWIRPGGRVESTTIDGIRRARSSEERFPAVLQHRPEKKLWDDFREESRCLVGNVTATYRCETAVQRDRRFLGTSAAALKRGSGEHSTLHAARQGRTADVGRAAFSQGSKSETDHLRYTFTFENGSEVCNYPSNSTHHKDKLNVLADLKRLRGLPKKNTPMFFHALKRGTT